jgi:creatinine amidohydrolase
MLLHQLTWDDVERYLKRSTGIIIPIGSTEQHGPNGLIGTDAICAEVLARGMGEAADALVAPTISVGMAQHHLAFAGSMTLRPTTLIAVVRDCVASLVRHGFTRVYFVNRHGGNVATVTAAFSEIYAEASLQPPAKEFGGNRPTVKCKLRNWWESAAVKALSKEMFGDAEGSHATPSEVSLTWYAYPEAERRMTMEPPIAPKGTFTDAVDYRRNFPDGRIGSNPGLASRQAGERLYKAAVQDLAEDYRAFAAA